MSYSNDFHVLDRLLCEQLDRHVARLGECVCGHGYYSHSICPNVCHAGCGCTEFRALTALGAGPLEPPPGYTPEDDHLSELADEWRAEASEWARADFDSIWRERL